jgi:hypothetical protein
MYSIGSVLLVVFTLLIPVSLAWSPASQPAASRIEQGYALLGRAQQEDHAERRDQLLAEAVATFKEAYQIFGQATKVQALIGAAQGYLPMRVSRSRFPFVWQATPLQRAEKSLVHALVLQPDNAAAALLLGLVYRRQAETAAEQATTKLQQSQKYLQHAVEQGLPIQRSSDAQHPLGFRGFAPEDVVILLRYVDAQGHGEPDDLLFVYSPSTARQTVLAVIVAAGKAYPLIADPATSSLASQAVFTAMVVRPQPQGPPVLSAILSQGTARVEERFTWTGSGFLFLGRQLLSP